MQILGPVEDLTASYACDQTPGDGAAGFLVRSFWYKARLFVLFILPGCVQFLVYGPQTHASKSLFVSLGVKGQKCPLCSEHARAAFNSIQYNPNIYPYNPHITINSSFHSLFHYSYITLIYTLCSPPARPPAPTLFATKMAARAELQSLGLHAV